MPIRQIVHRYAGSSLNLLWLLGHFHNDTVSLSQYSLYWITLSVNFRILLFLFNSYSDMKGLLIGVNGTAHLLNTLYFLSWAIHVLNQNTLGDVLSCTLGIYSSGIYFFYYVLLFKLNLRRREFTNPSSWNPGIVVITMVARDPS